jgi:PKD repeat protein
MVSLEIFNTLGQKIAEVVNEYQKAGNYSVNLSTENLNLSSGIYFYKLETGKYSQTKKMVILQ